MVKVTEPFIDDPETYATGSATVTLPWLSACQAGSCAACRIQFVPGGWVESIISMETLSPPPKLIDWSATFVTNTCALVEGLLVPFMVVIVTFWVPIEADALD